MINYEVILVILVLLFILISLYKEIVGPGLTFLIAIIFLGIFRVLTPKEILSGFANEQIAVIIMLLLLGDVFRRTSILDILFNRIFKHTHTYGGFLGRMIILVSTMSAFLNNTPLVAILMPYVHNWSKRNNIAVSKLLIPLSFAAILGGCATLIGTSTNLIVNGLVADQQIIPGLKPLSIFDFSYVGIPMIVIGLLFLRFFSSHLLPSTKGAIENFSKNTRDYIVEVQIKKGYSLIGKAIKNINFKEKENLDLIEIRRNNISITSNFNESILREGDVLLFSGNTGAIADIVNSSDHLSIPSVGMFRKKKSTNIMETVVSHNSTLIGKTVEEENFRAKYDATVLAVHRNGEKLTDKTELIQLKAGDAILLLTGNNFSVQSQNTKDFYVISKVKEIRRLGVMRTSILVGGAMLTILLSALGIISLFMGLIVLLATSLFLKISNPKDLASSIDYDLALIIALSLALGTAMIKTNVAQMAANVVINAFQTMGNIGVLSGIYLITSILAAFITNKAAVAIVFPISLTAADNLQLNPVPFVLIVAYAAAANFMTPIGYQTNLMVYGPGGYKFKHFLKIGTPLTIIYMIVTVSVLNFIYF